MKQTNTSLNTLGAIWDVLKVIPRIGNIRSKFAFNSKTFGVCNCILDETDELFCTKILYSDSVSPHPEELHFLKHYGDLDKEHFCNKVSQSEDLHYSVDTFYALTKLSRVPQH